MKKLLKGEAKDPRKLASQQFDNEHQLFKTLRDADVDLDTVNKMLKGAIDIIDRDTTSVKDGSVVIRKNHVDQVYVLDFKGDVLPSQGNNLIEEISAVLSLPVSQRATEVVLRLNSPGGTVSGYGHMGSQLTRLRKAGIKLTVCVDEVAASGGYMMACVGDRIKCAPFAYIGSIGVVLTLPNFAKRLQAEGLKTYELTAGKYKRTLGMLTEPTEEGISKTQEDIERVLDLFVNHISEHRAEAIKGGVKAVATGEVWLGSDALEKGLVDELMTSEEYIHERLDGGAELYHIQKIDSDKESLLAKLAGSVSGSTNGLYALPGRTGTPMIAHPNSVEQH